MTSAATAQARAFVARLLRVDDASDAALATDAAAMDWEAVLAAAGRGLHPMLAYTCDTRGITPPPEARATLVASQQHATLVMMRRRVAIRDALAALSHVGIEPVVLKGFALAHQVYPRPELRLMNDVDLWVSDAELSLVAPILAERHWAPTWRGGTLAHQVAGGTLWLEHGTPPLLMEVHAGPGSLRATMPAELAAMRARCVHMPVGDIRATVMAPEDQLLHLALHTAQHHRFFEGVGRLLDVARLVRQQGATLDWAVLAARARTHGVQGWVATTLAAAARLFGAPVPAQAMAALGVRDADQLAAVACDHAWLRWRTSANAESTLATAGPASRMRALADRARAIVGDDGLSWTDRWLRLRLALQVSLPAFVRAARVGAHRGAGGEQLRQLKVESDALVAAMSHAGDGH